MHGNKLVQFPERDLRTRFSRKYAFAGNEKFVRNTVKRKRRIFDKYNRNVRLTVRTDRIREYPIRNASSMLETYIRFSAKNKTTPRPPYSPGVARRFSISKNRENHLRGLTVVFDDPFYFFFITNENRRARITPAATA